MGKLGENIKRIREGMGLSQRQFGELIGKSDSQIWSYENDRTDILASTLYKIAAVANVDFNNLMAGIIPEKEPEKEPDPEWDAELRIYNMEDRLTVIKILAKNGYDVGQNKRPKMWDRINARKGKEVLWIISYMQKILQLTLIHRSRRQIWK